MHWYRFMQPSWQGLFAACLLSGAGLLVRLWLLPNLGIYAPYLTFYPVVALATLSGGAFSGLIASFISALLASYFFIEPVGEFFVINSVNDQLAMGCFIFSCFVISAVGGFSVYRKTKIKENRIELVQANQQISEILESITDGFFALDDGLRFTYANYEVERIFARNRSELMGRPILELYRGLPLDEQQKNYVEALQNNQVFHGEIQGIIYRDTHYEIDLYPKGKSGLAVYVRDVTEKWKTREQIREQAELLDLAHDFILVRDLESRIVYWNHGAELGYGWSAAEAIGQVTHTLLQTKFPRSSEAIFALLMDQGTWTGELIHTIKNGETVIVRSSQTLRRDSKGSPVAILEINHDITLQKQAQAQLLAFNTELEQKIAERTRELQESNSRLEEEMMERHAAQAELQEVNLGLEQTVAARTRELEDINATLEEEIEERQGAQEALRTLAAELEERVVARTQELQDLNAVLEEEMMEREKTQEAMQEEKERYEALLQQSAEAILVIDLESRQIVEINQTFTQMFGYSFDVLKKIPTQELGLINATELERIGQDELAASLLLAAAIHHYPSCSGNVIQAERTGSIIHYRGKKLLLLSYHDVTAERKLQATLEEQLELAAEVQKSMLPADYQDSKIIVRTLFRPLQLVSGDFYGYQQSPDGRRLNGYLMDVTGHGVATSLYSSAVNSLLNEGLRDGGAWTMDKLLHINLRLAEYLNDTTFVALIAFTFDFERNILTVISGGINYVLTSISEREQLIAIPGIYLGVTANPRFGVKEIPFQRQDSFYFMTDGIYEILPETVVQTANCFTETVKNLRTVTSENSHDDCSAICFHIPAESSWPVTFHFSRKEERNEIRDEIHQVFHGLGGIQLLKAEVALGEAIANALSYGHNVRVKINKIGSRLVMRVAHDGLGFAGNAVIQKYREQGLDHVFASLLGQEHGRGIAIMLRWSDQVLYNQIGNEVMLICQIALASS